MDKITREMKEHVLHSQDRRDLEELHESISRSRWRAYYHVQPMTGLMNDPNGFSFYKGNWHLFYQWFPFDAYHGMKHWYHAVSSDLYHWKNAGLAFRPDTVYDNKGCYSGSAIEKDGFLYFVYTGNHKDANGTRIPYQMAGAMDEQFRTGKMKAPIIEPARGYTEHQRDPKIFKDHDRFYILLGVQDEQKHGKFLLYSSLQLAKGWQKEGELKIKGYDSFGYMVECPDIEKIGDKYVLIFSPQGLGHGEDTFQNAYSSVYFIGNLDLENRLFTPESELKELDRGFDFYAPQCAYQQLDGNAAIMEAWFGCSDYTYPATDKEHWSGLQTLPRRLTIENGQLRQRPAEGWQSIKGEMLFEAVRGEVKMDRLHGRTPDACVIEVENPDKEEFDMTLYGRPRKNGFTMHYDKLRKVFTIDRGDMEQQCNTEFGTQRRLFLKDGLKKLQIFVDRSSVEIFINDGQYVMSSRIFPMPDEHLFRVSGRNISIRVNQALKTVEDNFAL